MFLVGKGVHPRSMKCPFKNAPPPIEQSRLKELVARLKTGDMSVADEVTLGHVRLAIYVAGLYANFATKKSKDLMSESFLALVKACHEVKDGKLIDDDFTRYAAYRMHKACGDFVLTDKLVRMPVSTKYLKNLKDRKIVTDRELANKDNTLSPLNQMILDEKIARIAKTEREKTIVDLRLQGYSQEEISKILDLSKAWIHKEMTDIRKRFLKEE